MPHPDLQTVTEAQQRLMRALVGDDASAIREAASQLQTAAASLARNQQSPDQETLAGLAATQRQLGGMLRARSVQSRERLEALGIRSEGYGRGGQPAYAAP